MKAIFSQTTIVLLTVLVAGFLIGEATAKHEAIKCYEDQYKTFNNQCINIDDTERRI